MKRSDTIGALSEALAKAQGLIKNAAKDSANPFFKSKYADLASVRDACAGPLAASGLAVMQFPRTTENGVEVDTLLSHSSGEWVLETLALPVNKHDAQGIGSAITYARRYGLAAVTGVAPEEDDGNAATASATNQAKKHLLKPAEVPELSEDDKAKIDNWIGWITNVGPDLKSFNAGIPEARELSGIVRTKVASLLLNHAKESGWRLDESTRVYVEHKEEAA